MIKVKICPECGPYNKIAIKKCVNINMKKKNYTDTELLDFLQRINNEGMHTKKCVFRISRRNWGWRLYESSRPGAVRDVRKAITKAMNKEKDT